MIGLDTKRWRDAGDLPTPQRRFSTSSAMDSRILVRTFPRIHMTLVDLGGATRRRFGGIGFGLDSMPATVAATSAPRNLLTVVPTLHERDRHDLERYLVHISEATSHCFRVEVTSVMRQHVGLGSKTALLLATGLACNAVAGEPLARRDLVLMSGRGGASGVGVNTAFVGGCVADGGHRATREVGFVPSSAGNPEDMPPLLARQAFPPHWEVHLFLPAAESCFGAEELMFFGKNTPIPGEEVRQVLAAVYHGIVPAFAEADLGALRGAVHEIHHVGFKRREVDGHGSAVRDLLQALYSETMVAAGMSSLGPLVYAIAPRGLELASNNRIARALMGKVEYLGCVGGRNEGYELEGGR